MQYSITLITTASDCDTLLSLATKEKAELALRKQNFQQQRDNYAENSIDTESELQIVNAQLALYQSIVNGLADGTEKNKQQVKVKRLETQQFILLNRKASYGAVAVLEKEHDISIIEKEIAEADVYIAAITDRKAQL